MKIVIKKQKNIQLLVAMVLAGKSGLSLARECGIHPVTVSHILNCRLLPKPATIKKIAKALNTTPKLLGY